MKLFADYEAKLRVLFDSIIKSPLDPLKYQANNAFIETLQMALNEKNSFKYPFDSLKNLSRLTADDNKFRIFNWAIAKNDGEFEYFAILQSFNQVKKRYEIIQLTDKSDEIPNPEDPYLDEKNWFGVIYYKIISQKVDNRTIYTLLGWDGNNRFSNKKVIEPLTIKSNGKPQFGMPIFRKAKEKKRRIIFEYSKSTVMILRFDTQQYTYYEKKKKKKGSRPELKSVRTEMIVFDRLIPLDPSLTGNYQFYVPELNVVDAYVFQDGKWVFMEDIDARNKPKTNTVNNQEQQPKRQEKPMYQPKRNP